MKFIDELHDVLATNTIPILVVVSGDFNLVRTDADKSNGHVNISWSLLFNDWINRWALIDFKISKRSFTWSNHQANLIMATLDRFLASTDWESKYPLVTVRALPKPVSDHTPCFLTLALVFCHHEGFLDSRSGGWNMRNFPK
jgi:exonuclease III